ncbi:MAG: pyrophosphohydrolase related protein [Cyanobacteria bacterium RYN_339]|nr:pyrophosphohydrolase related protein [Cyanobacteria bacterium RYN_339]
MENPWKCESSRPVYDNPWISIREDHVVRPDGKQGIYGVVSFKNRAIGVVPVSASGDTFLVGQFRYTLDQYSWEIPEGGGPMHESPLEAAQRELVEETGITAATWTYLGELHLSNSVTDEVGCVFLAEDLSYGAAAPEGTERLEVRRVSLAKAYEMAMTGEISDGLAVIGLARAQHFLANERQPQPYQRNFPGLGESRPAAL